MATVAVLVGLVLSLTFIISAFGMNSLGKNNDSLCVIRSASCKNCTDGNKDCYWCESSKECLDWKWSKGNIVPSDTKCKGYNFYFNQCRINGAGIIAIICISLVVVIGLFLCCCVCCCCYCMSQRRKKNYERLQERHEDRKRTISSGNSERRAERAAKRNEILSKYQINSDNSKYGQLA